MRHFIVIFVMIICAFTAKAQQGHVDVLTICEGEVYEFFNPSDPVTPAVTFIAAYSLDSVFLYGTLDAEDTLFLTLTVNPIYSHVDAKTISVKNLPYPYGPKTFPVGTVSGNYPVHFTTVEGCDSLVTLTLTVNEHDVDLELTLYALFGTNLYKLDGLPLTINGSTSGSINLYISIQNKGDDLQKDDTIKTSASFNGTHAFSGTIALPKTFGKDSIILLPVGYVQFPISSTYKLCMAIDTVVTQGDVIAINEQFCANFTVTDVTSIAEIDNLKNVKTYPNPVRDNLKIENLNEATDINIYSVTGQLVRTILSAEGSTEIDMSNLSNGMYFIKMQNGNSVRTEKIQVVK